MYGRCGANLVARPKADGKRCYTCTACGKIRRLAAPLEEYVAQQASRQHDLRALTSKAPPRRDTAEELRAQLAADEAALEKEARARFVQRSLSEREFRAARDALVDRIGAAQETLARRASGEGRRAWLEGPPPVAPWEVPDGTDPDRAELEEWRRWVAEVV